MFIKVYHTSFKQNRESILKYGLLTSGWKHKRCRWRGLKYEPSIFVSLEMDDPWAGDFVAQHGVDIWSFIVLKKHLKRDLLSGFKKHFYIQKCIPPSALRLIKQRDYYEWRIRRFTFIDLTTKDDDF
jgi:hypothetical protein